MKKVVGIYCGGYSSLNKWDDEIVRNEGAGGSETWAVEIASELRRRGYHVIVFGNPSCWRFAKDGVEYVPKENLKWRCEYQHFDYFISSRTVSEIENWINCPKVYLMSHEYFIDRANTYTDLKMDRVSKIAVLSEWHKNDIKFHYKGLKDEDFIQTFNGINFDLYKDSKNYVKENSMLWSSCAERGLGFFIDNIFPIIKREVPDFILKICSYNNNLNKYTNMDGVVVLGKLGKRELSEEQKKCKLWVYPNIGFTDENMIVNETFCISAVENAAARAAIVCTNAGGIGSTLSNYSGFVGDNLLQSYVSADNFLFDIVDPSSFSEISKEMAERSIKILTNDEYRNALANEAYDICKKYTWENVVNSWIKEFEQ